MSEQEPSDKTLGYRSGIDEARDRRPRYRVQVVLGAMIAGFAMVVAVVLFAAWGGLGAGVLALILTAIALLAAGGWVYRQPNDHGWAIGIWIGVGIVGLLQGLCFVVTSQ